MQLEQTHLRSSIVRRIVASFAVAALLPAAITAGLAYVAVERQLLSKSLEQLRQESKNYGLQVLQELQQAAERLRDAPLGARGSNANSDFLEVLAVEQSVEGVDVDVRRDGPVPAVWLTATTADRGAISGRLNPTLLWGTPETFPSSWTYCVLDADGIEIFCPAGSGKALAEWRRGLAESAVGTFSWDEGGTTYLAGYFTVPLRPSFTPSGWSVATIQAEDDALAAMAGFRSVFLPAMALSVVLALWFSYHQVRRRFRPLRQLTEATASLAGGDFSRELEIEGDQDFQILARSFNSMRGDLARQFETLAALSELDRQILATNSVQPIVERAVRQMLAVFGCRCVGVTVLEKDADDIAQVISCDASGDLRMDRIELDPAQLGTVASTDIARFGTDELAGYLAPMQGGDARSFLVMPILQNAKCSGVVALGYGEDEAPSDWAVDSLRDFADRLAVALQTVDRAERLYQRAHYDSLTGLPNRQLFRDRLERVIANTVLHDHTAALMFVDLDHFKTVNDFEGHSVGDALLGMAAERLRACVGDAETVARLGGDEFTIVLSEIESPLDALRMADEIVAELSKPFFIDVVEHFISASVGIAIIPADGDNVEVLLRNADTALYRAKELGRGRAVFFEERMNRKAGERALLGADLRHAIERRELVLHYQPKVDLGSGHVLGAEALVRWMHPTRGFVPPSDFVPIAEDTGVIVEIGVWVLEEALRQLAVWRRQGIVDTVAINVSYRQLRDSDVLGLVAGELQARDLPASALEIEVTESLMAEDKVRTTATLAGLRAAGVSVAIDDFGTGYSSLSYLAELPFDTLKLDRSFLVDFPQARATAAIVSGIIQIATLLGKSVVAEGVETHEQRTALMTHGCAVGQGYLFSRPLDAGSFETFARASRGGVERGSLEQRFAT